MKFKFIFIKQLVVTQIKCVLLATEWFPVTRQKNIGKPKANTLDKDRRFELTHNVDRYSEDVITFPLKSNWLICRNAIILISPMSLFPTCNRQQSHIYRQRKNRTQIQLNLKKKYGFCSLTATWKLKVFPIAVFLQRV